MSLCAVLVEAVSVWIVSVKTVSECHDMHSVMCFPPKAEEHDDGHNAQSNLWAGPM